MNRISGPGATPDHLFTEGDPSQGVAATTVTSNWLNGVQEELINVLLLAGITPDDANRGQLLSALKGFFNPVLLEAQDFAEYSNSGPILFGGDGLITITKAGWYHLRVNFLVAIQSAGGSGYIQLRKEDNTPLIGGSAGIGSMGTGAANMEFSGYFLATAGQKFKAYAVINNADIGTVYLQLMRLPFIPG